MQIKKIRELNYIPKVTQIQITCAKGKVRCVPRQVVSGALLLNTVKIPCFALVENINKVTSTGAGGLKDGDYYYDRREHIPVLFYILENHYKRGFLKIEFIKVTSVHKSVQLKKASSAGCIKCPSPQVSFCPRSPLCPQLTPQPRVDLNNWMTGQADQLL